MPSTFVAVPVGRPMSFATVQSLIAITKIPDVEVAVREGCSLVTLARNWIAGEFLFRSHDRIFWIDSDMRFSVAMFERMLEHSDRVPIVGASYPSRMNPEKPNVLLLGMMKRLGRRAVVRRCMWSEIKRPPEHDNFKCKLKVDTGIIDVGFATKFEVDTLLEFLEPKSGPEAQTAAPKNAA